MQTITPDKLEKLAAMDFEATPESAPTPEPTETDEKALTESLKTLEPLEFEDDDEPIEFEAGMSDRPFHKRPAPLLIGGAALIGLGCIGLSALIGAGGNDLSKVMAKNESPTGQAAQDTAITPDDPKDKTIGDLRSQEASRRLAAEIKKQDDARKADQDKRNSAPNRVPPTVAAPTTIAASAVPDTDYSSPAPYRSPSRSYSSSPAPYQSSYTPRYAPSSSYSSGSGGRSQSTPQAPAKPPKMLAFGAMPDDAKATPRQAQQPTNAPQNATYQTVSYNNQPIGFSDSGDALRSQQAAFVTGAQTTRIQIGSTAKATISSGAILPSRFLVQLEQPLGSMPIGTQIVFEPRTVYPNGKVEAYAVGIARGDYQRIVPVPVGAIAVFATNGKILKARKPSAGFFNSVGGQMLVGGLSGAASRFLATDSTTTITDAGSQTSSRAGGKGIGDVALSFAQGSVSPLMQQLRPQQSGGKAEFSLEPGQALTVKVLQPFTF